MRIDNEPAVPSTESIALIDRMAALLTPAKTSDLSAWLDRYVRNHRKRLAFDLDIVKATVPQQSKILEIGSLPPILTGALHNSGYAVTGLDIAPDRFKESIAAMGLSILKCDIEREWFPVESESFDCVLFNEVFEHLRINPIFTMKEVFRVSKQGGTLLLSTPNLRSLRGIINFLYHQRAYSSSADIHAQYEKLSALGHMGHVREYTSREVGDFLSKIGFEVEAVMYRGRYKRATHRFLTRLFPTLRPLMSLKAHRPPSTTSTS